MRVLVVEDDMNMAKSLEAILGSRRILADLVDTGEEAIEMAKVYDYDLVLLDLSLPDISGQSVVRALRLARLAIPVFVLSGDDDVHRKIDLFGQGADEYLTKPFQTEELLARITAVVRRSQGHARPVIQFGPFELNIENKSLSKGNTRISVSRKEYGLLELMALRLGTTVTKEMFLNHLYGGMDEPEMKIVDVFMCKLRRKLANANDGAHYIETIWGRGYAIHVPEQERRPAAA